MAKPAGSGPGMDPDGDGTQVSIEAGAVDDLDQHDDLMRQLEIDQIVAAVEREIGSDLCLAAFNTVVRELLKPHRFLALSSREQSRVVEAILKQMERLEVTMDRGLEVAAEFRQELKRETDPSVG